MKTSDTLKAALQLLKTKGWTKGYSARDGHGKPVSARSDAAVCFCAHGALNRTEGTWGDLCAAQIALQNALPFGFGRNVPFYNDDPRCEFKHVRALFGKAIKMCEARGE